MCLGSLDAEWEPMLALFLEATSVCTLDEGNSE